MNLPDSSEVIEQQHSKVQDAKQGLAFAALRYFDNAVWVGGVATGLFLQDKYNIPASVVAPAVGLGVTSIEYGVSGKAIKIFNTNEDSSEFNKDNPSMITKSIKEIGALTYASWAGSTSAVEVNNTLGIESSKLRRFGQAAFYGLGIALWTTDIPPYKQAREAATSSVQYWIENPVEGTIIGTAVSLGIFGLLRGIKATRRRISKRKNDNKFQDANNN